MLKYFSIIIGGYGISIRLVKKNEIVFNEFFDSFDKEQRSKVIQIFLDNPSTKVYILLDNIGQNYTIKKFPLQLNIFELKKLVNRKFDYEIPKTDLRTKIHCGVNKNSKEWEYLFVSSPMDEILKNILDFIDTLPNILVGIFMIPLESINLIKTIQKKLHMTNKNKPKWILLLVENKVSGIRQIAFNEDKLIFTRFLYNLNEQLDRKSKILYFENDVARTIGFMKRFRKNFNNNDLLIVGATTTDTKNIFANSNLKMINSHYFSSEELASIIFKKLGNISEYHYMDRVFEEYIVNKKSIFPFFTSELKNARILLKLNSVFKYILLFIFVIFFYITSMFTVKVSILYLKHKEVKNEIEVLSKRLNDLKNNKVLKEKDIDKIIEISDLYSNAKNINDVFYDLVDNLSIVTYNNTKIQSFNYKLNGIKSKDIKTSTPKRNFTISLVMKNNNTNSAESIIELFNNYKRNVQPVLMKKFNFQELTIKNLDFGKRYYNYTFEINLEEK